ncbi:MAG TPA: 30S ribosome-binding factor RbfA [Oscillospiraceae bacterium]|nr:30S ribosome-binding factor RbfA [Oscillospiraceae bacterium]
MSTYKSQRTAEDIKREIASVIRSLKDPRIADNFISISRIELTPDLSFAKVYISALEGFDTAKEAVTALTNAKGLIRKEISTKVRMRKVPEIKFIADNSIEQGMEIVKRMNTLSVNEENKDEENNKD